MTEADAAMLAAAALASGTGVPSHDVAVVMGSGWQSAADALGVPIAEMDLARIPGFAVPTSVGHGGSARSVLIGHRQVLLLMGRTHLYEGRGIGPVVHGVRTAVAAGADTVILTNAAGGLRAGASGWSAAADRRPAQPDGAFTTVATGAPRQQPALFGRAAGGRPSDRSISDGGGLRAVARPAFRNAC